MVFSSLLCSVSLVRGELGQSSYLVHRENLYWIYRGLTVIKFALKFRVLSSSLVFQQAMATLSSTCKGPYMGIYTSSLLE